jgi:hypothetical protein
MNKFVIYVIITLTISGLLLLPTFSSASTTSNVTLRTSGLVLSIRTSINKNLCVYGYSWNSNAISVAASCTLLITDLYQQSTMQSIKAINPNIKIVGYKDLIGMTTGWDAASAADWAIVNSHEDWFVHDANGNRLQGGAGFGPGSYLMDPSSPGWRQHYVSYVNNELASSPAYDGVFGDNCWDRIVNWVQAMFSTPIPPSVVAGWHDAMMGFLQYIKANLMPDKILVVNSDEYSTDDYLQIVDGQFLEGFDHSLGSPVTQVDYNLVYNIDALVRKSATGKIVCANSGTLTTGASQAQIDKVSKFCYAAFLLGLNGSQASWSWTQTATGQYNTITYLPIMDTNIGSPTGAYYSSQNVYMRDFIGGKVLFNPSANSYTINLGGTYTLLNGTSVTSIGLAPYTGETLLSPT